MYARAVGTCRARRNGKRCTRQLCPSQTVNHRRKERCSSPHLGGIVVATVRMLSVSRRSLLDPGMMGVIVMPARATVRSSGVLRRTVSTRCAQCPCFTTSTLYSWATAISTWGTRFVASKTKISPLTIFLQNKGASGAFFRAGAYKLLGFVGLIRPEAKKQFFLLCFYQVYSLKRKYGEFIL